MPTSEPSPTTRATRWRRTGYQWFAKGHGWLLLRTNGRPHRLGRTQYALVLETIGRKSGLVRSVPLLYLPSGDDFVILASNYGQEQPPAWWRNLEAEPDAAVLCAGRRIPVRARRTEGAERDALIERGRTYNKQWQGYFTTVQRELPVVVLERRPATD